jgi:hypothetical protein
MSTRMSTTMRATMSRTSLLSPMRLSPMMYMRVLICSGSMAIMEMHRGLCSQRIPDLLHTLIRPALASHVAQRIQHLVIVVSCNVRENRCHTAHDDIHVFPDLLAEGIEREIVDVVAEGVLDFATDECNAEDDICRKHAGGDGDPAKRFVQLEGEEEDVDPGDLTDGDGVCDWQRGVENAISACKHVVHGRYRVEGLSLVDADLEGAVVVNVLHVAAHVAEDLEREVSQWYFGSLEQFTGIGLGHRHTKELSSGLEGVLSSAWLGHIGSFGVRIEMTDEMLEVIVVHVRLETQLVFKRDGVGGDHVQATDFGEKILLPKCWVIMAFINVNPDETCEVLRHKSKLRPVFATLVVALVSSGRTKAQRKTNDETEHCEQQLVDTDWKVSAHVKLCDVVVRTIVHKF